MLYIVLRVTSPQSCPTLCDPMDCRPPGSFLHWIPQAKYWSGFPCPPPGYLPGGHRIKPESPVSTELQVGSLPLALPTFTPPE